MRHYEEYPGKYTGAQMDELLGSIPDKAPIKDPDFQGSMKLNGQDISKLIGSGVTVGPDAPEQGNLWIDTDEDYPGGGGAGGSGSGVHIGDEPPTDENIDLWIDTDAQGEEFYTAAEVDALLANFGGGMEMELLWENASPTSEFAAQTIALDLSGYDSVILDYWMSTSQLQTVSFKVKVGETSYCAGGHPSTGKLYVHQRRAVVDTTGVYFDNGIRQFADATGMTTNNGVYLPCRIYGIKGVS